MKDHTRQLPVWPGVGTPRRGINRADPFGERLAARLASLRSLLPEPKSGFVRNVFTLLTGTALAQAIPIALAPVLTRLYGPPEFGILGLYMSVQAVFAVGAMGRYETAILLPSEESEARAVAWLSLMIALGVTLLTLAIVAIAGTALAETLGTPGLAVWLYALPVTVFLTCLTQVLWTWSTRRQRFRDVSISRVAQALASGIVAVGCGLAGYRSAGLMVGLMAGTVAGAGVLGWRAWREGTSKWTGAFRGLGAVARRYRDFPRFSLPADLVNTMTNQLPTMLLGRLFGGTVVGFYSFTNRILNLPVTLLAASVSDVFRQRAAEDFARDGQCREVYLRTLALLLVCAIGPALVLAVGGPTLFALVFGPEWRTAGEYARILALLLVFRFVASPLSYVFFIAGGQRIDLVWQISLAGVTAVALWWGASLAGPKGALWSFTLAYAAMYLVNLALSYRLACGGRQAPGDRP